MTVIDTIFKALAPAIPDRVIAGHHADLGLAMFHGIMPEEKRLFIGSTGPLGGGWATEAADLGGEDGRWGATDVVGTLVATGSDNDKNIYAKFRFPCHPVVHRAGQGAKGGLKARPSANRAVALPPKYWH